MAEGREGREGGRSEGENFVSINLSSKALTARKCPCGSIRWCINLPRPSACPANDLRIEEGRGKNGVMD